MHVTNHLPPPAVCGFSMPQPLAKRNLRIKEPKNQCGSLNYTLGVRKRNHMTRKAAIRGSVQNLGREHEDKSIIWRVESGLPHNHLLTFGNIDISMNLGQIGPRH